MIAKNKQNGTYKRIESTKGYSLDLFEIIEISQQVIKLIGYFFPVSYPESIIVNGEWYGFVLCSTKEGNVKVGYRSDNNEWFESIERDTKRKAIKDLKTIIKQLEDVEASK